MGVVSEIALILDLSLSYHGTVSNIPRDLFLFCERDGFSHSEYGYVIGNIISSGIRIDLSARSFCDDRNVSSRYSEIYLAVLETSNEQIIPVEQCHAYVILLLSF